MTALLIGLALFAVSVCYAVAKLRDSMDLLNDRVAALENTAAPPSAAVDPRDAAANAVEKHELTYHKGQH